MLMEVLKYLFALTVIFDVIAVIWLYYKSNARDSIAKIFFGTFINLVLFELFLWAELFVPANPFWQVMINRFSYAFGGLAVWWLLYFLWSLVNKKFLPKIVIQIIGAISFCFAIISVSSNALIKGRIYLSSLNYNYYYNAGPLLLWFYIFLAPVLFLIIYLFIRGNLVAEGIQKIRLKYVGAGLLLVALSGMITFLFVPLISFLFLDNFSFVAGLKISVMQIFAGMAISFFSVASAYAVTRYRFLDIKVVLKRSRMSVGVYTFLVTVALLFVFLLNQIWRTEFTQIRIGRTLLVVLVLVALYWP